MMACGECDAGTYDPIPLLRGLAMFGASQTRREAFELAPKCKSDPSMDAACNLLQGALNIADGDVANYAMPRPEYWSTMDRDRRARALAEWLQTELRFAA